jgi:DNA-binding MarR family transcriptional regulator
MEELYDEDFNLWIMMSQAVDASLTIRQKELDKFGISAPESAVLGFLLLSEQLPDQKTTIVELTKWMVRSPNSISELIKRMEKKGLIKKVRNPIKKTEVKLAITEKGREIHKQSLNRKVIHEILSSLNNEDRQNFWIILGKVRNFSFKKLGIAKPIYPTFL